jgi:NitT/TauT family transport system substrate-binding protein
MPLVLHSALVLIAQQKRYFTEHRLKVVILPMASGAGAIDALAKGKADLALNSETAFVLAALERKDVRLLATLYRSRANMSIVALKKSGISAPRQLSGRRLGVILNTGADYFADLFLGLQELAPGEVTRVALKVNEAEAALLEGKVDAAALFHPQNSRLAARLGPEAVVFSEPAVYQMQFNLVARREFADTRQEAARRFLLALHAALRFLRESPEAAHRLALEATGEDPVAFDKVWQASDFGIGLDQNLLSVLEDEARWAAAKKTAAPMPNFLEFIDARALQAVSPGAVSILLP